MGMIRALLALYPRTWRAEFGDEFAALLEDTRLTPRAILDVTLQAGKLQAEAHRRLVFVITSLLWSAGMEVVSVHARLTANILWAPTTPVRAIALAATVGPWAALAAMALAHRVNGSRKGGAATAEGSAS
jgi:hypothetical protein